MVSEFGAVRLHSWLVAVPVVDIGPVNVGMGDRFMHVRMVMGLRPLTFGMPMLMMLIMQVLMGMRKRLVGMGMAVHFPLEEHYPRKHE